MTDKEYIIFCDESVGKGRYYSNFYGGLLVGSSQYQRLTDQFNALKAELNLHGEVKWSRVSEAYLGKYQALVAALFDELRSGNLKLRIMFRQNAQVALGLTDEQIEGSYFRLYYQFIKHTFGLQHRDPGDGPASLRLYFDDFPATREAVYAMYYDALRRRVEARGTSDFPHQGGQKLYGELTMNVTVDAQGRVVDAEIVRPSTSRLLDAKAVAIVHAAAPFGPFSTAMRAQSDQIVVTSRFRFTREDGLETTLSER